MQSSTLTRRGLFSLVLAVLVAVLAAVPSAVAAQSSLLAVPDQILAELEANGEVRIVVNFEAGESVNDIDALEAQVTAARADVLGALPRSAQPTDVVAFSHVPAIVMTVDAATLEAIQRNPFVTAIEPNAEMAFSLDESVPLINADDTQALGVTGDGVTVAIADSGIDFDHPDLSDDLQDQYCADVNVPLECPGGANPAVDYAGHGTWVSGTITSNGTVAGEGVAPDAEFHMGRLGGPSGFFTTDVVDYLNYLIANHGSLGSDIVNMSLGVVGYYSNSAVTCANDWPSLNTATTSLANLGIVVVAASGNDNNLTGVGSPACLPNVISVGASYDANVGGVGYSSCTDASSAPDQIACFTNRNSILDIMAPGSLITTSADGGGTGTVAGTSFASPIVAAVAAQMREYYGFVSHTDMRNALVNSTSATVSDPSGTGLTYPRVDSLAAYNYFASIAPADPINLVSTGSTETTASLSWTDQANTETGFRVYRDGIPAGISGVNVTTFTDTGLTCETTYTYYVVSFNANGESNQSNNVNVTTGTCSGGGNLLINGSFEDPFGGNWNIFSDDGAFTTGQAFDGSRVMLFDADNSQELIRQSVSGVSGASGDTVELTFYVGGQNLASGGQAGTRVETFNGGSLVDLANCLVANRGTFNWQQIVCTVNASGNYDEIRVSIGLRNIPSGFFGIDAAELTITP
ncbi:MAG: S8 family serine peptidase [Chloroflexi bacterium]|nr:S8 family serine peptidase [Chloroflexota bacterium]